MGGSVMWASPGSAVATAIGAHLREHEEVGSGLWASGPLGLGLVRRSLATLPQPLT